MQELTGQTKKIMSPRKEVIILERPSSQELIIERVRAASNNVRHRLYPLA